MAAAPAAVILGAAVVCGLAQTTCQCSSYLHCCVGAAGRWLLTQPTFVLVYAVTKPLSSRLPRASPLVALCLNDTCLLCMQACAPVGTIFYMYW
jgi:hypothetical protein